MPPGRPWDFQNSLSEIPRYPFPHLPLFQRGREFFSQHGINISTWNLGLSVFGTKQETESGNRAFLYAQGVNIRLQYLSRQTSILLFFFGRFHRSLCQKSSLLLFSRTVTNHCWSRKSSHLPTLHGSLILVMC